MIRYGSNILTYNNPALDFSAIVATSGVIMDAAFDYDNGYEYYLCRNVMTNELRVEKREMATRTLIEAANIAIKGSQFSRIYYSDNYLYVGEGRFLHRVNMDYTINESYELSTSSSYILMSIRYDSPGVVFITTAVGFVLRVTLSSFSRVTIGISYPDIVRYENGFMVTTGGANAFVRRLDTAFNPVQEWESYSGTGAGRAVSIFKNRTIALGATGAGYIINRGVGSQFFSLSNYRWMRVNQFTGELYAFQPVSSTRFRISTNFNTATKGHILS